MWMKFTYVFTLTWLSIITCMLKIVQKKTVYQINQWIAIWKPINCYQSVLDFHWATLCNRVWDSVCVQITVCTLSIQIARIFWMNEKKRQLHSIFPTKHLMFDWFHLHCFDLQLRTFMLSLSLHVSANVGVHHSQLIFMNTKNVIESAFRNRFFFFVLNFLISSFFRWIIGFNLTIKQL